LHRQHHGGRRDGESAAGAGRRGSARMSRRWTRLIAWVACAVVLYFVGKALIKQIGEVEWSQVHFRPLPAIAAVGCILGVSVVQLIARWTLLIAYGYHLPWR